MNILRAETFFKQYGSASTKLAELYDDDTMLQEALATMFPGFEYPDFSHRTLGEIWAKYSKNPRKLTSV